MPSDDCGSRQTSNGGFEDWTCAFTVIGRLDPVFLDTLCNDSSSGQEALKIGMLARSMSGLASCITFKVQLRGMC